ncbi:phytanoyl-CoA dioxygenase family protein [Paenibacillus cymbidii]|uniref:phytanoyl-CoA dioxygenase family protein n=1 Tax=Paenibacillus cymbidii TaxID=1639034 RepID=UPI001436B8DF|nr:phytanoyl-CoA dioxygenase family protein [Paenibacillus cymbidii]
MFTPEEKRFFLEQGYLVVPNIIEGEHLQRVQDAFDTAWANEGAPCNQHKLLKYGVFRDLIEHPPILDRHKAIFGNQVQLLQYDLLRQAPGSKFPERMWHRDFVFPGDRPLSINTILFIDDITEEKGPTRVVPRSHMGEQLPPSDRKNVPLEGEIAVEVPAGSAIFINSAIWHSGARNRSETGLRRGIYLYFGYWWLKRYEMNQSFPWQAYENASEQRLQLLGIRMPDRDVHMYDPEK